MYKYLLQIPTRRMSLPTTTIAGIPVLDTPLVNAAISFAKSESPPWLFHHVMGSWLFAVKLAEAEKVCVDRETLAVSVILELTPFSRQDLRLAPKYASSGRRFEVDGAVSAASFLKAQPGNVDELDTTQSAKYLKQKLRELTVWDAIAMHTTPSLAQHSVPEVVYCHGGGVAIDFAGLGLELLPDTAVEAVLVAYPRLDMRDGFRECLCSFARSKPQTIHDNFVGAVGEAFVKGYERPNIIERAIVASLRPN
ncbi:hypothetical protein K439DRAFT_1634688 [Ramaria rubella]|nr:hypothetical protein K439DRAFT_1634688 [Ramaria rubella]